MLPPHWLRIARPEQLAPDGEWLVWAFIAGRGCGKTRTMAEYVTDQVRRFGHRRVALVGRVPSDVRDVMIEGESGLLACAPEDFRPTYQPSIRRLTWPNGAIATTYSSENPSELRGPQHDLAWCDEPAAWNDARKGDVIDTSWNNLMLGLRLGKSPRCVISTTPRNVRLIREVLAAETTVKTTGTTYDNLANLAPTFRAQVLAAYEGTRIGRQELMGELLTDVEGALVSIDMIDGQRLKIVPPDVVLVRIVVAVDPATTSGEDSDETGIIVCAKGNDGRGYVLADLTCKLSPDGWARVVAKAYEDFSADRVIAEKNQGGDMVETIVRSVMRNISYRGISARVGKRLRAEPVTALYEQGRISHVGAFPALEDQLTTWVPDSGESPDRLDALVHGMTELGLVNHSSAQEWLEYISKPKEQGGEEKPFDLSPVATPEGPPPKHIQDVMDAINQFGPNTRQGVSPIPPWGR